MQLSPLDQACAALATAPEPINAAALKAAFAGLGPAARPCLGLMRSFGELTKATSPGEYLRTLAFGLDGLAVAEGRAAALRQLRHVADFADQVLANGTDPPEPTAPYQQYDDYHLTPRTKQEQPQDEAEAQG
ncbi:hypothetical protein [Chitinolyticbacter meiyuanensis]|uniref:hypothetical protein n=1 Tax=Chitinolyticbacter meiyuanensis TaxID=682798 RepID=UPI0011E5FDCE|nr:hypothetical protein [Chitinolyticbacter meiyuanensis]